LKTPVGKMIWFDFWKRDLREISLYYKYIANNVYLPEIINCRFDAFPTEKFVAKC
jgi:hypothetical protein